MSQEALKGTDEELKYRKFEIPSRSNSPIKATHMSKFNMQEPWISAVIFVLLHAVIGQGERKQGGPLLSFICCYRICRRICGMSENEDEDLNGDPCCVTGPRLMNKFYIFYPYTAFVIASYFKDVELWEWNLSTLCKLKLIVQYVSFCSVLLSPVLFCSQLELWSVSRADHSEGQTILHMSVKCTVTEPTVSQHTFNTIYHYYRIYSMWIF